MDFILKNINNPFFGPIVAVVAGLFASASPCAMAAVPLLIGHLAGTHSGNRKRHLTLFVLGMAVALSLAGIVAGLVGKSLAFAAPWIRWVAGLAFVAAGLTYMEIFSFSKTCDAGIPLEILLDEKVRRKGAPDHVPAHFLRSLGLGMLYGFSASPCATPALLAILTIVATSGSVVRGGTLLLGYSLGQSALVVFAGLFTASFTKFLANEGQEHVLEIVRKMGGAVVTGFGLYLLIRPYL